MAIFAAMKRSDKYNLHLKFITVLITGLSSQLTSCKVAGRVILGIDSSPDIKSDKQIKKDFKKFNIAENQSFVLDTTYYPEVKQQFKKEAFALSANGQKPDSVKLESLRKIANDNTQPAQLRYFDSNGKAVFKMVNCYIDPPIPMSWNVDGCLEVFPPAAKQETLNKGNKDLEFFLKHIATTENKPVAFSDLPKADYYAVIFRNSFYKKPSKKLIKQIRRYDKQHPDQTTFFLFVNNHNSSLWEYLNADQKAEVLKEIQEEKAKTQK